MPKCIYMCVSETSRSLEVRMTSLRCFARCCRNYELHFKCNSVPCLCICGQLLMPSGCSKTNNNKNNDNNNHLSLSKLALPQMPQKIRLAAACNSCNIAELMWPTFRSGDKSYSLKLSSICGA